MSPRWADHKSGFAFGEESFGSETNDSLVQGVTRTVGAAEGGERRIVLGEESFGSETKQFFTTGGDENSWCGGTTTNPDLEQILRTR